MLQQHFLKAMITVMLVSQVGCAPYRVTTVDYVRQQQDCREEECRNSECEARELQAAHHWLYCLVPRHRCQLYPWDIPHWIAWALLGNDDDGLFGEAPTASYRTCSAPSGRLAATWAMRNPLHNFTFYVIGNANCPQNQVTLLAVCPHQIAVLGYQPRAYALFACKCSSLLIALHGYKPFVSIRLRYPRSKQTQVYAGWRERGNFGLKFQT